MDSTTRTFNARAFTALMMTACAVALPVTGYYNHVQGFDGLTVSRHAWMSAHNALGVLFVVFAAWHVLLNRRALWHHVTSTAAALPGVSRRALVGCALVGVFLFVVISHAFHVPPRP